MIRLIDVRNNPRAPGFLWELLDERTPGVNISHREMPTMAEHLAYVERYPYRAWYIVAVGETMEWVGVASLTHRNEIGIQIARSAQRRGYGLAAVRQLISTHAPKGEPGAKFLANINPQNAPSLALFKKLGATLLQVTYQLP